MKFSGYNEQTHRALYTNFQRNLKFYKNIEICMVGILWDVKILGLYISKTIYLIAIKYTEVM